MFIYQSNAALYYRSPKCIIEVLPLLVLMKHLCDCN